MGREKRNLPTALVAGPKERHKRAQRPQYDHTAPVPAGFMAKPAIPRSKHHTYLEFVQNTDKKKKLEFQITTNKSPPPGFAFVPIGNPQLTAACKELSRTKEAMIFIVSGGKNSDSNPLAHQMHRVGHHIRQAIMEEARGNITQDTKQGPVVLDGLVENIPESQEEYHAQVDAALRDLFPRIPNTDRQMIIEHAFSRRPAYRGEKPVGLCDDVPLTRRVQLAVLAHIRHTHTRYDLLLRETNWQNARKVVEALCLDILVKWRGDEESGRDQLDEILREVVVISDSEGDDSDEDETTDTSVEDIDAPRDMAMQGFYPPPHDLRHTPVNRYYSPTSARAEANRTARDPKATRMADKKGQRGFKRYRAAWEEAIQRKHDEDPVPEVRHASIGVAPSSNGYVPPPWQSTQWPQPPNLFPPRFPSGVPPQPVPEKVNPAVFEQISREQPPHHTPSPVGSRFQDMLVRSIETASPQFSQPSFVRPVPPRGLQPIHSPPTRPDMQHHPGLASLHGERPIEGDRPFAGQRVISDHLPSLGDPLPGRYAGDIGSRVPKPGATDHLYPQSQERIIVNVPRPGERPTSVIMQNRGAFYERVSVGPNNSRPVPPEVQMTEFRPAEPGFRHMPEPRRILSWEQGSKILNESRGDPGVEIMPIPRSRVENMMPNANIDPGMQRYYNDRPMAGGQQYSQPLHRDTRNDRPPMTIPQDGGRFIRPRPSYPENVIYID